MPPYTWNIPHTFVIKSDPPKPPTYMQLVYLSGLFNPGIVFFRSNTVVDQLLPLNKCPGINVAGYPNQTRKSQSISG
jgi:hypothetical protein